MKIIAKITLEKVAIIDQSGSSKLIINAEAFSDKGDDVSFQFIVAFPKNQNELVSSIKTILFDKLNQALTVGILLEDIFIVGDLVVDSNESVEKLDIDVKKVQSDIDKIKTVTPVLEEPIIIP